MDTPVKPTPIIIWRECEGDNAKYRQQMVAHGWILPGNARALPVSFMGSHDDIKKEFKKRGVSTKEWDDKRLVSEWDTLADLAVREKIPMTQILDEYGAFQKAKRKGVSRAQQNVD